MKSITSQVTPIKSHQYKYFGSAYAVCFELGLDPLGVEVTGIIGNLESCNLNTISLWLQENTPTAVYDWRSNKVSVFERLRSLLNQDR